MLGPFYISKKYTLLNHQDTMPLSRHTKGKMFYGVLCVFAVQIISLRHQCLKGKYFFDIIEASYTEVHKRTL